MILLLLQLCIIITVVYYYYSCVLLLQLCIIITVVYYKKIKKRPLDIVTVPLDIVLRRRLTQTTCQTRITYIDHRNKSADIPIAAWARN